MDEQKTVKKLSLVGITGNILLTAFKLTAGIIGHSQAMVSDAIHSASDVFATVIAWIGEKLSLKKPDRGHPYGHDRFECVASLLLGFILILTGFEIGKSGIESIVYKTYLTAEIPGLLPLIAGFVSIVVKEIMYHYTMHYAKILNSSVFKADAWHHRSDALSSVGSVAGICAARLGLPIMDPIASVIICLFILKVAVDIIRNAVNEVLDTACSPEFEKEITDCIMAQEGVAGIDLLHTRRFGDKVYVDVEISVARESTLVYAHSVAERVHNEIEKKFPLVKHIMVHVNPAAE